MTGLTETQTTFLRGIFNAAPDTAVFGLEKALTAEADGGGAMACVFGLVAEEAADRRVRAAVFGPLVALCRPTKSRAMRFPSRTVGDLWRALREAHVDEVVLAQRACLRDEAESAEIYDRLCALAAEGLRHGGGAL